MAVVKSTDKGVKMLARLMRAEAVSDGNLAMLMVGNVGVNRIRGNCLDFEGIRTIEDMVFQQPGGFEAVHYSYFYQRARQNEIKLARRVINGERKWPASNALWFFKPGGNCPSQWYGQPLVGKYKSFCYYHPQPSDCPNVFGTF